MEMQGKIPGPITVEEFMEEWEATNDWLPRQIVKAINEGRTIKVDGTTLLLEAPMDGWYKVAWRK